MNLIEQLGGYEQAKSERDKINYSLNNGNFVGGGSPKEYLYERLSLIEIDLLEYRRANNIFEVGDKVVFNSYELDAGVREIQSYHNGCIGAVYRHATDEEIKVGYRI